MLWRRARRKFLGFLAPSAGCAPCGGVGGGRARSPRACGRTAAAAGFSRRAFGHRAAATVDAGRSCTGAERRDNARRSKGAACGSIRLSAAGTIGGLVMENIGYSTPPDSAAMTIRSLDLAAGLCGHLNGAAVVDNFTAEFARLRGLVSRPIVPEITFGIYAVSNPQTVRSKASEVLLRAIKRSLSSCSSFLRGRCLPKAVMLGAGSSRRIVRPAALPRPGHSPR